MLSANNILSPATGRPVTVPSQDMVFGAYYLTLLVEGQDRKGTGRSFRHIHFGSGLRVENLATAQRQKWHQPIKEQRLPVRGMFLAQAGDDPFQQGHGPGAVV